MKSCTKCNKNKELSEFYKRKNYKNELSCQCKQCDKEYSSKYKQNKKYKEYQKIYYLKNKGRWKKGKINKETRRKYELKQWKINIKFKLSKTLRTRLREAIRKNFKRGSAIKDLGCSIEHLKNHLESLFQSGMTWNNYGIKEGQWSIDHIIPLSRVDLTNRQEFLKVNNFNNLRPMWHIDNIKKGKQYP